ncbi:serine/threonine protein kinase [bacterium]|nr:serine/threonine protein kinase [bacterium]
MTQPKRCPTCLNIMPLARRKCPYCFRVIPAGNSSQPLEVVFLQEKLAGKFEIISEIHHRCNNTLFLAQDLILDRKVALKTLKFASDTPKLIIDLWKQNLKRCLRVDEPLLAQIYTFGIAASLYYVILEFIVENTLEDILSENAQHLPIWKCLRIGRDISQGLHSAHKMGITHHRITPSNISVSSDGYSRILDLGTAQGTIDALAQHPWSLGMDSSLYFAPEQIESGISEPLSDQYRIGAILYRILSGRPAYSDGSESGAFTRLSEKPEPIRSFNSEIPRELDEIVLKAMSINPDHRFNDCRELALQLESLDPDYWLPEIDTSFRSATSEATVALMLDEVNRNEKDQKYFHAVALCQQALALAPYNAEVTSTLLRVHRLHDKNQELASLINKALITFYANNLTDALKILNSGRKIDENNAELLKLTHEIMREQERHRLVSALIDASRIDLAKQALSSSMSNVIRVLDIDPGNKTALKLKQKIEFGMEDRATLGLLVTRAEAAYKGNRLEEACGIIGKIQKLDPSNFHAKKLIEQIDLQKKHHLLVNLWERLDKEFRNGHNIEAVSILKKISKVDPSLKAEIRSRLLLIREKIAEQDNEELQGETKPIRAVKPSDLSLNRSSAKTLKQSVEETPVKILVTHTNKTEKPLCETESKKEQNTIPVSTEPEIIETFYRNNPSESKKKSLFIPLPWLAGIAVGLVILSFIILGTSDSSPQKEIIHDQHLLTEQPVIHTPKPRSTPSPIPANTPTASPKIVLQLATQIPSQESNIIKRLLSNGLKNEQNGSYEMAAIFYKRILKNDRSNAQALQGLQRCQKKYKSTSQPPPVKVTPKLSKPSVKLKTPTPIKTIPTTKQAVRHVVKAVRCYPEEPHTGKEFKVVIDFEVPRNSEITHLWLNYKKPGDLGFAQIFTSKHKNRFTAIIPGRDITGSDIQYFLNGLDNKNIEFFFGSPNYPKILP